MAHAEFHTGCPRHPKIASLSDGAFRLWFNAVCYCQEHLTDGVIPKDLVEEIKRRVTPSILAEMLRIRPGYAHGLWEDCGDHYRVHDYLDWQDSRAEIQHNRAALRERVKRHRSASGNAGCNGVTNAERNAEDTPLVTQGTRPPSPEHRTPDTEHTHEGAANHTPIATGPHRSHAACGRVCVPAFLHVEFRTLLGGDELAADEELRRHYRAWCEALPPAQVVTDPVKWLRAQFARTYADRAAPTVPDKSAQRRAAEAAFLERHKA